MKLLFINVSIRPDAAWKQFPMGLGYVMTATKAAGFSFDLLDIDINTFSDDYVDKYLATHRYDVIAFGTIVTHYRWCKWLAHTIRTHQPGATIVVGNSVGESIAEILFASSPVDVVVQGEGDVTFIEVLKTLKAGESLGEAIEPEEPIPHSNTNYPATIKGRGVKGVIFRDPKGRIVNNGRRTALRILDDIPFPDWELIDVERYIQSGTPNIRGAVTRYPREAARPMPVTTARGCISKCTFCHYMFWHDPYRHRSAQNVIAEIRRNQKQYGANYINFWDDLSFHKLGPAEKFVDGLIEADLGIHFTAAVRSDLFGNPEFSREDCWRVAQKFEKAGCVVVNYSLESGSDEILDAMNKRVKSEYFVEQTKMLRQLPGISIQTSLVFGYPQETKETIAKTMDMCLEMGIYPSPGFLLPLPGTGMWQYAVENGFITDAEKFVDEVTERQDVVLNMTSLSNEELFGAVTEGLQKISDALNLGFSGGSLVRTGGFQKHGQNQVRDIEARNQAKPELEFNYAKMSGGV